MSDDLISIERRDGLLAVTLDRPDKANALSQAMLRALLEIVAEAEHAAAVNAMTITGAGERVFCGGADMAELSTDPDDPSNALWRDLSERLSRLPILTVARINGACIGGGLTLALACDLRVGAEDAVFGYPALRNGVLPDAGDCARLRALIGPARTALLLLGGVRIDSEAALSFGLIDRRVPPAALDAAVAEVTSAALSADPEHFAAMKRRIQETAS